MLIPDERLRFIRDDIKQLDNEKFFDCFMGKIFFHWSGRNAWYSTWCESEGSFHITLDAAKGSCDNQRQYGTTFSILEIPTIVINFDEISLAIPEMGTNKPFSSFTFDGFNPSKVSDIYDCFRNSGSTKFFICEEGLIDKSTTLFWHHKSLSYGGDYHLGWTRSMDDSKYLPYIPYLPYNLTFINSLINIISESFTHPA